MRSGPKSMRDHADAIDSVAVIFLCLIGLASTLLIYMAGSFRYGFLSTVLHRTGLGTLLGCSFTAFLIAAAILRRMYRVSRPHPHGLLVFTAITMIPFAFFLVILVARFIHGEH